jgi:uncharacterized protein
MGSKKSVTIYKLVQHMAYRISSEISSSSLATEKVINPIGVEKYIDILEKNFIIFTLSAYSNYLDNEIKKGKKIYL